MLVAAAMVLFAFPPLIAGSLLLEIERAFHWPFFDPRGGGDPLLWQHLFWLFGHPEVYIIFLPSVALIAMIVPTFARTPHRRLQLDRAGGGRHRLSELRAVGAPHVHHRAAGHLARLVLGRVEAVAIPTGVQIFCFIATLARWAGRSARCPCSSSSAALAIFVSAG